LRDSGKENEPNGDAVMTFRKLVTRFTNNSLRLPEEAQCGQCGRYNIAHPEVAKKLKAAGYTKERAVAVVHCTCGTEIEKRQRIAQEKKLIAEYAAQPIKYGKFAFRHDADGMGESRRRR